MISLSLENGIQKNSTEKNILTKYLSSQNLPLPQTPQIYKTNFNHQNHAPNPIQN